MTCVALIPVLLSALMLAAHFLRAGSLILSALYLLGIPLLLIVRSGWSARAVQVLLVLGALEWLRIIPGLVQEHQLEERPWVRMVVILVAVALFTTASVAMFRLKTVRRRYGLAA